jgi:fructose-1,6-bisphosphatase I
MMPPLFRNSSSPGEEMTATVPAHENLLTLQSRLASGKLGDPDLAGVIGAIALASKSIAHKIRRARIEDVIGDAGADNLHGERQQKLDVLADELLLQCLRARPELAVYASEEQGEPLVLRPRSDGGRYCVLTDPLDGSSNVDVAVSVGTIFSILPNDQPDETTARAVLQPGSRQLAAGYVLYGSSVLLVLTTGAGVDVFVLDPEIGEYVLVIQDLKMPEQKLYSINEAYWNDFEPGMRAYLGWAHENGYGARYVGSMVADVHRTLLKGGVFLYPPTSKAPGGKLRLLYEGCPMALLIEQAGGAAAAGDQRILDIQPEKLHQRTGVLLGSPGEMEHVTRYACS